MMTKTECPFASRLDEALNAARSGGGVDSGSTLDEHVNGCPLCQARIQQWVDRDTTTNLSPRMATPGDRPDFPGLVVLGELGRGGMGVVFKAWDPQASRHVALKIMPGGPVSGDRGRARWLREARSATRVKHPNVVQLHQVGESGGWLCLVFEYVAGGSLADRIKGPIAPRDAAELLRPVASAVAELHREGVVHLDLKPSNILLDSPPNTPWPNARPKVADFGIARSAAVGDGPGATLAALGGTPSYMAPEQAEPRPDGVGPAADVYAIGATLYELLTGRPPFVAASMLETMDQVRTRDPVPPRSLNPNVPRDLETIALKCLQKEPSRRYPTAEALADDLDRWLDGRPVRAKPVSAAVAGWRWCRRNPVVALLSATVFTGLIGGLATAVWISWRLQADRLEAESNARAASNALAQLLRPDLENTARIYDSRSFLPYCLEVRGILLDLVGRPSNGLKFHRQLARADQVLGDALIRVRRHAEAQPYLEESLRLAEEYLHAHPRDKLARTTRFNAFCNLANDASYLGDEEASLTYQQRAVEEAAALVLEAPEGHDVAFLACYRGELAARLAFHGDANRARSLLEANRRMLDRTPAAVECPEVVAARAFERMNFERAGIRLAPDSPSNPDSADPDRMTASAWAEYALDCLRAASRGQDDPRHESQAAYAFAVRLTLLAAEQRHTDRLDLSRQTADRTLALGQALIRRDPQSANAHMVLGEGQIQAYKIAWQDHDRAAVLRFLKQSIGSVQKALVLDPSLNDASGAVDQRRLRLKEIESEEAPADPDLAAADSTNP